jgi:Flp pilus assembly protein CpaB
MKSKTMILMAVAVVCGLVASYLTTQLIAQKNATVKILYAKQKINAYTPIKNAKDMFEEKEVLQNQAPADAVTASEMDKLETFTLVKDVAENQPLVNSALKDKLTMGLEAKISPGMRAVAINTNAAKVSGGFVLPDSHVDVYQTNNRTGNGDTKLLLQNVLVRAVDQLPARPEDKPGHVPTTVTLELSPKDTQKLIAAQDSGGVITLALRPFGDNGKVQDGEKEIAPPPPTKEERANDFLRKANREGYVMTVKNGPKWMQIPFQKREGKFVSESDRIQSSDSAPSGAGEGK